MSRVHVIRHKVLVEGLGIRRAAREMGVSRNTVRKYLNESEPCRVEASPRARPVYEKVKPRMDALLDEWSAKTTRKQRVTGTRLHGQLVDEGYEVGLSLVRAYLRERQASKKEVTVPLVWHAGDAGQVDFFEVTVDVGGARRKAWMFVMRLMYSGRDFAWLYDRCDQVSFLDAHVRAFEHFGAVPQCCIYDNLGAAVKRRVGIKRELAGRFLALVSHYLCEPCFARPGEGHDKGGVESRGKAIRLQHLTPIPQGESLDDVSHMLLDRIDGDMQRPRHGRSETTAVLFAQERPVMLPLPEARFEARKTVVAQVYASSKTRVLNAWYSLPTDWPRTEVTALVGVDTVELLQSERRVVHPRVEQGKTSILYRHYLPELARKPQALRQVAAPLLGELGEPFGELWRLLVDSHGPHDAARVFGKVIAAVVDHGEGVVADAVKTSIRLDDNEMTFLAKLYAPQAKALAAIPAELAQYDIESACAADFDAVMRGGAQ